MKKKIIIFSLILFIIDFIVKFIIKSNMLIGDSVKVINNFFNITYVVNTGAAFSIFEGMQVLFIILGILLIYYLSKYIKNEELNNYKVIYYSLLTGGVIGNLFDRIIYHHVIDYLDFTIFNYKFAIFNLADCFIVISILLIIIEMIRKDKYDRSRSK